MEMARLPKVTSHTKAINVIYHNFWEYVRLGMIKVYPISTHDQVAYMLTKPFIQNIFFGNRVKVWGSYNYPHLVWEGVWDNKKLK